MRYFFLIFIIFSACSFEKENRQKMVIDLTNCNEVIYYSNFVDSVSYLTLNLDESISVGEVQHIYKWKNYYYIGASSRDGVLVYDTSG